MNSSLILSSSPNMRLTPLPSQQRKNDLDTYNPATLTRDRFASMYATDYDFYAIHFFSVRRAIVEITIVGPYMPFIYSRRVRDLPKWTGLSSKFNDNAIMRMMSNKAVLVFADIKRLQFFRDVMCTRMPPYIRYCLFPNCVNNDSSVDDIAIQMARYYGIHGHLYDNDNVTL